MRTVLLSQSFFKDQRDIKNFVYSEGLIRSTSALFSKKLSIVPPMGKLQKITPENWEADLNVKWRGREFEFSSSLMKWKYELDDDPLKDFYYLSFSKKLLGVSVDSEKTPPIFGLFLLFESEGIYSLTFEGEEPILSLLVSGTPVGGLGRTILPKESQWLNKVAGTEVVIGLLENKLIIISKEGYVPVDVPFLKDGFFAAYWETTEDDAWLKILKLK